VEQLEGLPPSPKGGQEELPAVIPNDGYSAKTQTKPTLKTGESAQNQGGALFIQKGAAKPGNK